MKVNFTGLAEAVAWTVRCGWDDWLRFPSVSGTRVACEAACLPAAMRHQANVV